MIRGNAAQQSPRRSASWRGRYIDGVWHCDCDPRLPADRFQTKKEGANRGRWFYTCQLPQHKRCKFFLWESDAQIREKQSVLANSISEPMTPRKTPVKSFQRSGGLLTPTTGQSTTGQRRQADYGGQSANITPSRRQRNRDFSSDEDAYGWDNTLDNEVEGLLDTRGPIRQPIFSPETPRKTPRTAVNTSPGKRKLHGINDEPPPYSEIDGTQSTLSISQANTIPSSSVEISATPTPRRYQDVLSAHSSSDNSELASSALSILDRHDVVIPTQAKDELVVLLDQHHLKFKGILRGRDISRVGLQNRNEEIALLKERIEGLEAEREMDRITIAELRSHVN